MKKILTQKSCHCSLGGPVASIRSEPIVLLGSRELTTTFSGIVTTPGGGDK
jgi:hypothetical protein